MYLVALGRFSPPQHDGGNVNARDVDLLIRDAKGQSGLHLHVVDAMDPPPPPPPPPDWWVMLIWWAFGVPPDNQIC